MIIMLAALMVFAFFFVVVCVTLFLRAFRPEGNSEASGGNRNEVDARTSGEDVREEAKQAQEPITSLLRASQAGAASPDTMVRPAMSGEEITEPEQLLRSSERGA